MANELSKTPDDLIELIETDRLQTLSVVAGEILRRVKEPLGIIRGRAETLKGQLDFYQRDNVQGILDQLYHLETLIKSIENVIDPSLEERESIRPKVLIEDTIHFFHPRLTEGKIQVMNLLPEDLEIGAPANNLKQILVPILINAIEVLETGNSENKNIFVQYQQVKKNHLISVEDSGDGLTSEELQNFFTPLRSKKKGHIGLSLSICKKICQNNHWQLKAFSQKGKGTRVELWIPQDS